MYICVYACRYGCLYVRMHVCIYAPMFVCMYIVICSEQSESIKSII